MKAKFSIPDESGKKSRVLQTLNECWKTFRKLIHNLFIYNNPPEGTPMPYDLGWTTREEFESYKAMVKTPEYEVHFDNFFSHGTG